MIRTYSKAELLPISAFGGDASSANRSPYRLAVPEKILALFVRSIFSTATDSPPRFIRHRRRLAPNPTPRDPLGNSLLSPIGGEKSPIGDSQYGYRRGGTFDSPKVPKSDLG